MVGERYLIDTLNIKSLDHLVFADVAEQRDFLGVILRQTVFGAAHKHIGLDADAPQFLDRMLGRLGLEFPGCSQIRHQGQVYVHAPAGVEILSQLADRFEKRQAFDITHGAADLGQDKIHIAGFGQRELLYSVGDMGDDLHGAAQIIAAPLLGQDLLIDAAGRDIVALPGRHACKTLVMPEIEIGLGAIVGHIDLAVLVGAHGARIDIQVRIELAQPDLIAPGLKKRA